MHDPHRLPFTTSKGKSLVQQENELLETYHVELCRLLSQIGISPPMLADLKVSLEIALCDWRRFSEVGLGGYGDSSATRRVHRVLDQLDSGRMLDSEQAYIDAMLREFPV